MKIIHWNISKATHLMYGVRKYEDELFFNIRELKKDWEITRIQRREGRVFGNTVFSWPFYKCDNADVVHATFQTLAPAIYFTKPKKFIVTVHDLAPLVYQTENTDVSTKIQWLLTPKAFRKADKIIAISEFTKNEIIRLTGIDRNKIRVIYQGVDHTKYKPIRKEECRNFFGLMPEKRYVLVVSSNLQHKRMDLAKKLFDCLKLLDKNVQLLKAGYGEALEGKNVINVGWVSEDKMPLLFNSADIYLHTSEYEGFGLPILEAMACGVPVIAPRKASIPEIVGPHDFLLAMNERNIPETAKHVLALMDSQVGEILVNQSKKFSWEKTAKDTIELYIEN